ncbi:DUF3152 domain-containing protein [Streptomyces rameus]|uniref:DUF3152 domain-containing protein n=1 Tax=Streptomyces rameus TaxID=68261 RepID=UPI003CD0B29A
MTAQRENQGSGRGAARPAGQGDETPQLSENTPAHRTPRLADGTPAQGTPELSGGAPARGRSGLPDGASVQGASGASGGAPGRGVRRLPDGTGARGASRLPDGTAARGTSELPDGVPARGRSGAPGGAPARGRSGVPDGASAQGAPGASGGALERGVPGSPEGAPARGGHPEQREAGGGWGEFAGRQTGAGGPGAAGRAAGNGRSGVVLPRQRQARPGGPGRGPGPRQDYLDAFDGGDGDSRSVRGTEVAGDARNAPNTGEAGDTGVLAAGAGRTRRVDGRPAEAQQDPVAVADGAGVPAQRGANKGWALTGIAAAAVTTVLAVVVAGQVTKGRADGDDRSGSAAGRAHDTRTSGEPAPSAPPSALTLTYDQKMAKKYPLGAKLTGSGKFDAVPGLDRAPGPGQKYRYRVDVEQGLGLDGALFAEAVQKTLNDKRSWAHGGALAFERVSSGKPDFVITLASPGTTVKWCAKSGLDTLEENVSCDSAATERVMINAYRWAQGSQTYGDRIHAYRQMLINHEVGHRLGHGHVSCQKDGALAPVMQQQTKFLDHDGIHCRPNPWPYPSS